MGGEMVTNSWFSSLWRTSRKRVPEPERPVIGILAFEVVSLMSKVVSLWNYVKDRQVVQLTEEIVNSFGIRMLVSQNDDYLISLIFAEMMENLGFIARSTARLGKRCADPVYHHLEVPFGAPIGNVEEWSGWVYKWKKMERKVKKMERFIEVTGQLYHELDVLSELDQSLRRMRGSVDLDQMKLLEYQQKVLWQRQEVKILSDMSPWNRTYDYIVLLLVRSVLTILERIKHVFGINQMPFMEESEEFESLRTNFLPRSYSISAYMPSLVCPSENSSSFRFFSGPLTRSFSKSGLIGNRKRTNEPQRSSHQSPTSSGRPLYWKTKHLANIGPFKGCMMGGSSTPILRGCTMTGGYAKPSAVHVNDVAKKKNTNVVNLSCSLRYDSKLSLYNSKCRLLNAPQSTLGGSALALHYANIIILIEKLASSHRYIGLDTIDDLYSMLPTTLRAALRARLKPCARTLTPYACDAALATEWSLTLTRILEWLAPLAHNMIRWQSERNFEKQHICSRTNMLLVQTIYFADQARIEAAIMELLVGLNYVWRFRRELNERALLDSAYSRAYQQHLA